jgi:hypothetical protein
VELVEGVFIGTGGRGALALSLDEAWNVRSDSVRRQLCRRTMVMFGFAKIGFKPVGIDIKNQESR